MPEKPAGMRIDPPPSVPMASIPMPAAREAAAPPDEPPGVLVRSHGLRVMPVSGESVTPFQPNSGVVVLPMMTVPASRRRATQGASSFQSCWGSTVSEPRSVGQPRVRMMSLMVVGTPSMGLFGSPLRQRFSEALAAFRAWSASTRQKALSLSPADSMRLRTALATSTGETLRLLYAFDSLAADSQMRSLDIPSCPFVYRLCGGSCCTIALSQSRTPGVLQMPATAHGPIRLFKAGEIARGELERSGGDCFLKLLDASGANDGGRNPRLVQGARQAPPVPARPRRRSATLASAVMMRRSAGRPYSCGVKLSDFERAVDFSAGGLVRMPRASGLHGNDANAFCLAQGHHLTLFLAVEEVVVILHGDEAGETVLLLDRQHLHELPGPHATRRRYRAPCRP